jgi:hypothetical protein
MPRVSVSVSGDDVTLRWNPAHGHINYKVYRHFRLPYFRANFLTFLADTADDYMDRGALTGEDRAYYVVLGESHCGALSADTERLGAIRVDLVVPK